REPIFAKTSLIRHIANSRGIINFDYSYLDMVRPSLITFGYLPQKSPPGLEGIAPCFSLKTKVSYLKVVEKGQGISYGHSFITTKKTRIVTVPIGYGDGYRRCLSNKGSALIRGQRFPIVGNICMDQFMIDIQDKEVHVGDEVVLIGRQGQEEITLMEIAHLCETIPYEVLCLFNQRLPRIYIND
nr:alanine racemase [Oligoflexia bacterium]